MEIEMKRGARGILGYSLLHPLRGTGSGDTPTAIHTPSIQSLLFNIILY